MAEIAIHGVCKHGCFRILETVNGKADMPVSTGDAALIASAVYAAVAGIAMANSCEYNLHFRQLDDMRVTEQAAEINAAVPRLKTPNRFEEARGLLDRCGSTALKA